MIVKTEILNTIFYCIDTTITDGLKYEYHFVSI
jgi:hypothetical protein